MSKIKNLKDTLLKLKEPNITGRIANELGIDICLGFFLVAKNNEKPTEEDRIEIVNKINNVSDRLIDYIESYKSRFYVPWEQDEVLTCQIHSGIYFMKDDYINLILDRLEPDLKESIKKFIQNVDYNELNECMNKWKESTDSFKPPRPSFVPSDHFWWS